MRTNRFEGNVDWYGPSHLSSGWFLSGSSPPWYSGSTYTALLADLDGTTVECRHAVAFYPRSGINEGFGFILHINDDLPFSGKLTSLQVRFSDTQFTIAVSPKARLVSSAEVVGELSRIFELLPWDPGADELRKTISETILHPPRRPESLEKEFLRTLNSSTFFADLDLWTAQFGHGVIETTNASTYFALPAQARPRLSWLFDAEYYNSLYPDVAKHPDLDPFVHYVLIGVQQGRSPHPLIDTGYIRLQDKFLLSESPTLSELCDVLRYDLASPSPYFVLEDYQSQLPGLADENGSLLHFLTKGVHHGLKPNNFLDLEWYRNQVGLSDPLSALRHFVLRGDRERRAASAEFDGNVYLELNPDVAVADSWPLRHFLEFGRSEGRQYRRGAPRSEVRPAAESTAISSALAATAAIYSSLRERIAEHRELLKRNVTVAPVPGMQMCDELDAVIKSLALPEVCDPKVSVLVPVYNHVRHTVECIASIAHSKTKVSYEIVIADDASTDPEIHRLSSIDNLVIVSRKTNGGFLENCNSALSSCQGEYVFLLNNDAQLLPGTIDALVDVLEGNDDVAAAGPKIIYPNGRLQEAGCTLDRRGVSDMVGLFGDPNEAQFNFDRDVHYCSGAALLIRRAEIGETLFDHTFAPAYCEDADLCLRLWANGRRVMYAHQAEVVHHLSVSFKSDEKRLWKIVQNQQKLTEKWAARLAELNRVRIIAFYLPQYHTTPENDFFWGQGFTEWTNVAKAGPVFKGHQQPHLPTDLGFYDLRVKQVVERQTAIARRYGLSGFCVYYYNFGTQRALDRAFEAVVADSTIDFPFCVCWANENWTRHWDGGDRAIIFEQKYDDKTLQCVIDDAVRLAADSRYICVNGKPIFVVYRPLLIPNVKEFTDRCRRAFLTAGFQGVHLVYVESMELAGEGKNPSEYGFDASVEFPPHGHAVLATEPVEFLQEDFAGSLYDYEATLLQAVIRPMPGYKRYPTVFPSWDNTPRQPTRSNIFVQSTPEAFQVYVEEKLEQVKQFFVGDERLLFVNAWNEWAEGTHLEPDQVFGHRWLEAIRNALLAKSMV